MSVSRTVSEILSVKECRDLETKGRGRSRSLKMAPYDISLVTALPCYGALEIVVFD